MSKMQQDHGWAAVPRSFEKLLTSVDMKKNTQPLKVEDIDLPSSELAQQVLRYAKEKLSSETFNHSLRVFYYGRAVTMQHFPDWRYSAETYLLACLLHDIGTVPANMTSTHLSFEFHGGLISLELLKSLHADIEQAELVAETIIRHQDIGDSGNVTTLTAIILFATVLDNAGLNGELVHQETIKSVVDAHPRNQWTDCFASVVRRECELKPWANTTRIEGFAEMVEKNELMAPYDR
ncbi:hypothetical protein BAUCODRAFT_188070 [Baudoinia panamericana UAMH 10762]|uniref:HD domain-containing protein n=1 Tax=Baudoinia panamericana (strain UAMH 10762) TaxID=717646 RepID=M2M1H2_BAUPA|nr:uncharacterized protein BAUCODRAFT_188070 [Baudoinia panamericana UAMH 10762]EMD00898.1 hypothetical protein BAUCODRAFT_188070 [Baudoinia panamericana UAMH 10762]